MTHLLKLHIIQRYFKRYLFSWKFNRLRIYSIDLYYSKYKNNLNRETLLYDVIKISSYSLICDYIILKNIGFGVEKLFELIILDIHKKQYSEKSLNFEGNQILKTILEKYFDIFALYLFNKIFDEKITLCELKQIQINNSNYNSDRYDEQRYNTRDEDEIRLNIKLFFLALDYKPPGLEDIFAEDKNSSLTLETKAPAIQQIEELQRPPKIPPNIRKASTITDLDKPSSLYGNDNNVDEQQDSSIRGENKTGAGAGLLIPVLENQYLGLEDLFAEDKNSLLGLKNFGPPIEETSLGLEDLFAEDENSSLGLKNFAPPIEETSLGLEDLFAEDEDSSLTLEPKAPDMKQTKDLHRPPKIPPNIRKASTITDLDKPSSLYGNDNNVDEQQDSSIPQQEIEIDLENFDNIPQLLANEESQISFVEESISNDKDFTPKKSPLDQMDDEQSFSPKTTPFLDKEFQQNSIEENAKEKIMDFSIQFSTPKKNLSDALDSEQSFTTSISPFLDRKSDNNHHKDKIIDQSLDDSIVFNHWREDWATKQYPESWDNLKNNLDYSTDSDHKILRRPKIPLEERFLHLDSSKEELDISLILEEKDEEVPAKLDKAIILEEDSEFIKKWKKSFELNNKRLQEWRNSCWLQNANLQEIDQIKEKVLQEPIHSFPKKTSQPEKTQNDVEKEESIDMILLRIERNAGLYVYWNFFNMKNLDNNEHNITSEKNPIIKSGCCYDYSSSDECG